MAARRSAGFSITEAAQKLGFKNYQTLSAIEKGARKINAHELVMMARLYGRSLDYFLESDLAPDPVPLWRKLKKTDANQIHRQFLSFLENYSNPEHLLGLKRPWKDAQKNQDRDDLSVNGFDQADKLGAEIHNFLDLGSRPSFNLLKDGTKIDIDIKHVVMIQDDDLEILKEVRREAKEARLRIDPGESTSIAYLIQTDEEITFCSCGRAAIKLISYMELEQKSVSETFSEDLQGCR